MLDNTFPNGVPMINEALLKKVQKAKSVEDLIQNASKEGISLERNEAERCFSLIKRQGELGDDELDSVSGGGSCNGKKTKCPNCNLGEPLWRQYKNGDIRISCTCCPAELDYANGHYFVKSEYFID